MYVCLVENRIRTTEQPVSTTCDFHEIKCYVTQYRHEMCLHNMFICDGNSDCARGEDENENMCGMVFIVLLFEKYVIGLNEKNG